MADDIDLVCCSCNGLKRLCKGCVCVKASRPCSNCVPDRSGQCQNPFDQSFDDRSSESSLEASSRPTVPLPPFPPLFLRLRALTPIANIETVTPVSCHPLPYKRQAMWP